MTRNDPSANHQDDGRSKGTLAAPQWHISTGLVAYPEAIDQMQIWADAVADACGPERVWVLEHPALYTAGTSARREHLLDPQRLPVFSTGRGGEYTYHGPGQRVVYVVLDVRRRFGGDVRAYVAALEDWIVATLGRLGVRGHRGGEQIGVWVGRRGQTGAPHEKIASIGVRLRRGVSLHGLALNVAPNLEHFSGIIACGGDGARQTSLAKLGVGATLSDVDQALRATFEAAVLTRGCSR